MIPTPVVRSIGGTLYKLGEMVAKKTDQVGRDAQSGALVGGDSATFEKLNQAVNSCKDLVWKCVTTPPTKPLPYFEAVVPVLVVPADLLWQVDYSEDGAVSTPPRKMTRSSLFLNHSWSATHGLVGEIRYRLSHLEIITLDALRGALDSWLGPSGFFVNCGL
jgi:hypothetical protein